MGKIIGLGFLVCLTALFHGGALAQNYPSKPIHIVVPWPAGGAADQRSRQLAEKLSKAVGQPVVVENKSGASGTIGAGAVAKARPDGYTLLYGTVIDLAINPAINSALPYDSTRDFAPITQAIFSYLVLSARSGLGVSSMKEVITLAKAKPGQLTCGSGGNATTAHIALEALKRSANLDIIHVAFKGEAPVLTDLLGGHLDLGFNVTFVALPHIKAGKIIPLAVTSPKRLSTLSEVPTAAEVGVPEMEVTNWGGLLAPAGTPSQVIMRLNTELVKVINSPEIREQWTTGGAQVVTSTPEEFAAFIRSERLRWARLVKGTGVKMD